MNNNLINKLLDFIDNMPQDISKEKLFYKLRIIYKETVKEFCQSLTEEQLNFYIELDEFKTLLDILSDIPKHRNYKETTIRNISALLIDCLNNNQNKEQYLESIDIWIKKDLIRAYL